MEVYVFLFLGAFFILSGIAVFLYNIKRKRRRINKKMPSGFWFILGMIGTGSYTIHYALTTDFSVYRPVIDDSEFEMIEINEAEQEDLEGNESNESAENDGGKINMLSEISKSTFGK